MNKTFSKFESELQVRPDDIDMNQHVHNSKYFDYVLAARYDQIERCYKVAMDDFIKIGFSWVVRASFIEFRRPLGLGDFMVVRTWIEEIRSDGAKVRFEIVKKGNGKISCDGFFEYAMINVKTGRAEKVPDWIIEKYSI